MQTTLVKQTTETRTEMPTSVKSETTEVPARSESTNFKAKTSFAPGNGNGNDGSRALIEAMVNSRVYQDYERAFAEATGLPLALRPVESWQLPHHGKRNENPFCVLMSQKSRACSACLQTQESLSQRAAAEPQTVTCPAGLCDTAVPVHLGDRLIGFLQTGQIFRKKPTQSQFDRMAKLVSEWGIETDRNKLQEAYFSGKVVSNRQHESVVK